MPKETKGIGNNSRRYPVRDLQELDVASFP